MLCRPPAPAGADGRREKVSSRPVTLAAIEEVMPTAMQQMYIILYRYKAKGEKKPGPVRQYRIYADDLEEAKRQAARYANYPDIEIVDVKPA
jgi:hypothetical protein